jgi:hypothetical protein
MKLRLFIGCIILLVQVSLQASAYDINYMREQFYLAVEDEQALERLEKYIEDRFTSDPSGYPPVILAYKGGVEALKAKHAFSPFAKFSHLLNSLEILEDAVSRIPGDLEVRFIRFSILDNIPGFLGYGSERRSDKEVIIKNLLKNDFSKLDTETQQGIIEYLLRSDNLTEDEKNQLSNRCVALRE